MGVKKILVVDDEKLLRWSLQNDLGRQGYQVDTAENGAEAYSKLKADQYDVLLLDIRLPDTSGIEILKRVRQADPHLIVVIMTGHGDVETAVEAMRAGAYDYVSKPFNLKEISARLERAIEAASLNDELSSLQTLQKQQLGSDVIIGRSKAMQHVSDLIGRLAASNSVVLLLGESGTGKDLVARHIHFQSARAQHPFVDINCAALPENLLESEMMGHERGAFTDAKQSKTGLFELAHRGTLYLDEVGDMPLSVQPKLLKLIETRRFRRLGGVRDIEADVRIIAATNKDPVVLLRDGRLREDLYYRLKVVSVTLPPLRERKGDIPLLLEYFLRHLNRKRPSASTFSEEALHLIMRYDWPGNVRELRNVVERALILNDGGPIDPVYLPPEIIEGKTGKESIQLADLEIPPDGLPLENMERALINKTLARADGNICKAARMLGLTRDTLRYRIKKLNIK
jgi:two-component system response regulator AtoC